MILRHTLACSLALGLALAASAAPAPRADSASVSPRFQRVQFQPTAAPGPSEPARASLIATTPGAGDSVDRPARLLVKLHPAAPPQQHAPALVPATGGAAVSSGSDPDGTLATLAAKHGVRSVSPLVPAHARHHPQSGSAATAASPALAQRIVARAARAPAGAIAPDLSRTYVFDLGPRPAAEVQAILASLRNDAAVVYAEEDRLVQTCYIPNDPSYSTSGSWQQPYEDLHGLKAIDTASAWDATQGLGVVVAVIDTGVDFEHPDIAANIWLNTAEIPSNNLDDDNNGFIDDTVGWDFVGAFSGNAAEDADPMDFHGHGTHVAGTIAATGDNGLGVVGVAWKSEIMVVKGLDDNGGGYDSQLARCIVYAVDNGADIINASWGSEGSSQALSDAVNYAHAHGVVFVAAAGNNSADVAHFSPANIPAAIAVAALDPYGNAAYFSNFGSRIDVAAPGDDILSLEARTGGYARKSGTSMAAPHVSGLAALILATHPTFSPEQVRQTLRVTAMDLGAEGKDPKFGYGRIAAVGAVTIGDGVLESRILSPFDGTAIAGPITLTGCAGGTGFARYQLEYGAGAAPTTWTFLSESTTAVANGELGRFDPAALSDGLYTVRLRSITHAGANFSDEIPVIVRYLEILWPATPAVPSLIQPVKPGSTYPIVGSARGASFQNYVLEWAPGGAASSGWSTEGFTLVDEGRTSVVADSLGTWTPPATLAGPCTIRLTVNNSGFSSVKTTQVYAEPDLASGRWPALVASAPDDQGPTVVRQPDGTSRLVSVGRESPVTLSSFAFDGSLETVQIHAGSNFTPVAANLDGQPGDEIVVTDGSSLEIYSSRLEHVRTIPAPPNRYLGLDQITLADLDRDGAMEILAPSRQSDAVFTGLGALHILRADGTPFSDVPPPTFTTAVFSHAHVVAADLDGDGRQEIVMGCGGLEETNYRLACFTMDGSPYPGWPELQVVDTKLWSLSAADLDHDGASEIIVCEHDVPDMRDRIRVIDGNGAVRPGWPVLMDEYSYRQAKLAIGDLDGDSRQEIVLVTVNSFAVLRDDGSAWCEPWAKGGSAPFNASMSPLLADIDNDGTQEIITLNCSINFEDPSAGYYQTFLEIYERNGTLRRSWPIFGLDGHQPFWGTPLVGDFNADGKTDLVISTSLIRGGGLSGWLIDSSLTCLTIDSTLNMSGSHWVSHHSDPRNSRVPRGAPSFAARPEARTAPAGSAVTLRAKVTGNPYPTIQWYKDGVAIPGATGLTVTFGSIQSWDAGRYTITLAGEMGTAMSEAVVTVLDEPSQRSRTLNLSTRAVIRTSTEPMIPGFVVAGTGTKQLLIRAVGPRLVDFGVAGAISDPNLVLKRYDPLTRAYADIAANDNWPAEESLVATSRAVGAFSLKPSSLDAALLVDVTPGQYTVFAAGDAGMIPGIALVEIYDTDPADSPATLVNVSNRGYVGVGNEIMIPGFVVAPEGAKKFLIRAVGPGLRRFGVGDALADPQLSVYRTIDGTASTELVLANDNWSEHPDAPTTAAIARVVGAFQLEPASEDAAFVATLRPGAYTIHARGHANASGEALVELYVVP